MPLQIGKIPIVVPRKKAFGEHVNDHQVDFAKNVSKRMGTIIFLEDTDKLDEVIENYDRVIDGMYQQMGSNNKKFNEEFESIVNDLIKK